MADAVLVVGALAAIKLPPKQSFAALQHGFKPFRLLWTPVGVGSVPRTRAEGELMSQSSETLCHSRIPGGHGERWGHMGVSRPRWLRSPWPVAHGWQVGGSGGLCPLSRHRSGHLLTRLVRDLVSKHRWDDPSPSSPFRYLCSPAPHCLLGA